MVKKKKKKTSKWVTNEGSFMGVNGDGEAFHGGSLARRAISEENLTCYADHGVTVVRREEN